MFANDKLQRCSRGRDPPRVRRQLLRGPVPLRAGKRPNTVPSISFAVLLQYEQGSEQAGSVDVVSAGVHYARMDRRERNARILLNGKGIRIGPQHDTPFRIARSGDPGQKTRSCNPLERNTCFGQPIGKVIGRFMFLKREFGVGVAGVV